MKSYRPEHWFLHHSTGSIRHVKGGEYLEGCETPIEALDVTIPHHLVPSLIAFLDKEGYIRPKMDNQSRAEDLRIVHRLFDLLENKS